MSLGSRTGRESSFRSSAESTAGAAAVDELEPARLEQYRGELTGYCYRMLGSFAEAEDAVQETMIRAWRSADGFEGRASARTWLHRVATNVCIDMLRGRRRRALPMGLVPSTTTAAVTDLGPTLDESAWVLPAPDANVLADHADPAARAAQRETVRLAFVAALQHLPARQRATLLLRDVIGLSAAEVAQLLEASVASVNSALQRARATLAAHDRETLETAGRTAFEQPGPPEVQREVLAGYVDAFERYDIDRFTALLREDALQSMPPWPLWIRGREEIGRWMLGPGAECRGSLLLPVEANGSTAFGQYRVDGRGGHTPFAIQLLTLDGDKIGQIHSFVMPELFPLFGLPTKL